METNTLLKLEVFSEDIPCAVLWYKVALRCKCYHLWFHEFCFVHGLHCVWCSFPGMGHWDTGLHTQWVCHSGPPLRLVLSTPLTLFVWLCA